MHTKTRPATETRPDPAAAWLDPLDEARATEHLRVSARMLGLPDGGLQDAWIACCLRTAHIVVASERRIAERTR